MSAETTDTSFANIKEHFLDYFAEHGHLIAEGSGIVARNDPTLLFINCGMAAMKGCFTGEITPLAARLANTQFCVRTNDIDAIGDTTHGTSFTMMGNWSLKPHAEGGYGKQEAIDFALELLTEGYGISTEKLWATVFATDPAQPGVPSDDESRAYWGRYLPGERIVPSPAEDNFWGPAGTSGPCGPCTEVFYDRGDDFGTAAADGESPLIDQRHVEIWNAGVFMQYNKDSEGVITPLKGLFVDAGAGLERFAMVLENAPSIHEVSQYLPAYEAIRTQVSSVQAARLIFDHLKTAKALVEAGVVPDKNRTGSVARRLLRRSLTAMTADEVSLDNISDFMKAIDAVAEPTPQRQLSDNQVNEVIANEIQAFSTVLKRTDKLQKQLQTEGEITGDQVFKYQTSLGIPADIIKILCGRYNVAFPEQDYKELVQAHRLTSRA